jgi:hypothetical protein
LTSNVPKIQVCDTSKAEKPRQKAPQPQQQETQKLYRRLAALERTQKEQLKAIRAEQTQQSRMIRELPRHETRKAVRALTTDPQKYEKDMSSLEFNSKVRRSVRFYAPYSTPDEKYDDQPALVQLSWYDGGELWGLNPTEVEELREKLFAVHELPKDHTFNRQSPYYAVWMRKDPVHLWITLRQDESKGLCWCCCIAKHIRELRDQDKVQWAETRPVTGSSLSLTPEEMEEVGVVGMVRESQAMFLARDAVQGTVPWEVWNEWPEAQAALAKLREEAYPVLESRMEVLREERWHLESTDLKVVEFTPRS